MNIDKNKLIQSIVVLVALFIAVIGLSKLIGANSQSLTEYAAEHPELTNTAESEEAEADEEIGSDDPNVGTESPDMANQEDAETQNHNLATENLQNQQDVTVSTTLTGAALNADTMKESRITYADSFYYEPLSDNLRRYITGVSFPVVSEPNDETSDKSVIDADSESAAMIAQWGISYDTLRYVHILHYDFDGNLAEGELICNEYIAQDLVEIFYELYRNEYQIEKVLLIDEYDGDDIASMEDNNTSCFNYRTVQDSTSLSKHALGLAIDINPLYNPYITYNDEGGEEVSPASAEAHADRSASFPYKIDENDLCYKLFTAHGFTWGGNWNSCKDYQHFQKPTAK